MKKILSILGMTNFIVIWTILIISCGDKLTKSIEQPKPTNESLTNTKIKINSIFVKNPSNVTQEELNKILLPEITKKIKEIDSAINENHISFIFKDVFWNENHISLKEKKDIKIDLLVLTKDKMNINLYKNITISLLIAEKI
ncbi:hypothetical protein [Spiroplasma endosymbiont of 'Nebria riversi']|uniref:hypothetical protein n=1 Tax=Spiroplasma endosymbiont of 'Nebria riversi' TaxID=2792084 RepID=UPI001C059DB4|nr:hypothetical protein [Spiroplasma endosymbiont of 'Nebria riversi']